MSTPTLKPMTSRTPDQLHIFDTTLRDGEQAPGFSMNPGEKLEIARLLEAMRVDTIEAGFAAASPGDAEAIRLIASEIRNSTLCSLARATEGDIDAAAKALEPARRKRLHIFIATSPIHREAKLRMSRREVLQTIERCLQHAAGTFDEIEFSAEDALRTEPDFLVEAMSCAAAYGADVLNVPDTVGYSEPGEIQAVFERLIAKVARPEHVIFSAHCHNDLGLAVANSLAAVKGGARQVECAINGIGERAGNCSLEEIVMALQVRADIFPAVSHVDATKIWNASQRLQRVTGAAVAPNKAIVGKNAFAHEAGIHQHGMISDRRTYEIMTPESVGAPGSALVLGKHSGKHALIQRLAKLGYKPDTEKLNQVFIDFKHLADELGEVNDADLVAMMEGFSPSGSRWTVLRTELRTTAGRQPKQFARIELEHPSRGRVSDIASGDGPMAAAFAAVQRITGTDATIIALETRMRSTSTGREFVADISVDIDGNTFSGRARGPDVLTAAIDSLLFTLDRGEAYGRADITEQQAAAAV
ncbi:2-isopropylmalate synthase [Maricaulis maris]|uniref:2-isopropylmalate synthase n=1 Tax=Maricaulis maris TaxID=74318 RepID=UPI0029244F1D|nr:2-isopropylmalate synthase [Maricaulis maris]